MIFSLRKATIQDFDSTYEIKKNALSEYLDLLWGWNEDAQFEFHQQHFEPLNFQIIEISQKPIGYLEIYSKGDSIFLANLMILKSFQGKDIGKNILTDLLKTHSKIELEVLKVNLKAKYFYERFGFIVSGENDDSFMMRFDNFSKSCQI
jgi:N-acetylglutamate synthase-like GNAT family acetyltransferase